MVLIGLSFGAWQLAHIHDYAYGAYFQWSNYDEGVYLSSARLLNAGHPIFSQVFSSQPLLFLEGLALAVQATGGSADGGHVYALVCGLFALSGVGWLSLEIGGRASGVLAMALLALSPGFVLAAHAVESEAPVLAFGSLAVAASARYARVGQRRWLAGASLLLAAAVLSKLLAVSLLWPIGVAMLARWWEFYGARSVRATTREPARSDQYRGSGSLATVVMLDLCTVLGCFLAPLALVFGLISPAAQWDQVVRFHLKVSEAFPSTSTNFSALEHYLMWDPALVAFSVVGLAAAAISRKRLALIPIAWLAAELGTLGTYHPLFVHHITVLVAPFAVLGGRAADFGGPQRFGALRRLVTGVLLIFGLVAYLLWLPEILGRDGSALTQSQDPVVARQVAWLDAHSSPSGYVVVDNQVLAVAADRAVPPALVDTSIVREESGYLPLSLLVQATVTWRAQAVLLTRALYDDAAYVQWLRKNYREVTLPAGYGGALAFLSR